MRADEQSSFLHSIGANYQVKDIHGHAAPLFTSRAELAAIVVLVVCSIASATAGCLHCWTYPTKRLQLLVVRTTNLLCAAAWGVLCWEQLSRFPDSVLALACCTLAATLHVVVICAQRGQCSFPELPAYTRGHAPVDKILGQGHEDAQAMLNPLLVITRKPAPRGSTPGAASPVAGTDCDASSMSECLIFDIDNMPGMVVVPKSQPSSEKVAKFYQSKLLCVVDDKSKDM